MRPAYMFLRLTWHTCCGLCCYVSLVRCFAVCLGSACRCGQCLRGNAALAFVCVCVCVCAVFWSVVVLRSALEFRGPMHCTRFLGTIRRRHFELRTDQASRLGVRLLDPCVSTRANLLHIIRSLHCLFVCLFVCFIARHDWL